MIFKGQPKITTIVLHHTAVSRSIQELQYDSVNNYHKGKWNFKSELGSYVGYNFFCEATGKRTQARKIGEETVAQIGMNCDVASRCGAISYCMAGDFTKELPTQHQVNDFNAFIKEVKQIYPDVVIKQHKDIQPGRTCAELTDEQLRGIIKSQTKEEYIEQLEKENKQLRSMVTQLISFIKLK